MRRLAERLGAGCQAVAAGYDGADEAGFLTAVAPVPPPGVPPALSAFLRGVGPRALLFSDLQSGQGAPVDAALARAIRQFAAEAGTLPMARWPARFWQRMLAELPRPATATATAPWPGFDGLPAAGTGARASLLLALVAGLDEEDGGAALGVDAATWRLALRRAAPHDANGAFDEAGWRALAAAARDAQRALPGERLQSWGRRCEAALALRDAPPAGQAATADAGVDAAADAARRRLVRVLWGAVAACALALAATFVPWRAWRGATGEAGGAAASGVPGVALDDAAAPRARYDDDFALRHHPDLALLLADADARLRELDLSAWYAARLASEALPPPAGAPGSDAPAAVAQAPFPEPAFDALPPERIAALRARTDAWDRLPRAERGVLRERWLAWQRLPPAQRGAVRAAGDAFATLPPEQQAALREEFAAQPLDLQRGWLLGPVLGARWAQLEPLLMQVPDQEREPLLSRLQAMDASALDALAVVAQRTPPQSREALRRRLLAR